MLRNDRDFKKYIAIIVGVLAAGLLLWNLAAVFTSKNLAAVYYERIAAMVEYAVSVYPDIDEAEWIAILNGTEGPGKGEKILNRYGIFQNDLPIRSIRQYQNRFWLCGNLLWIAAGAGVLWQTIRSQRKRNEKLREMTTYIRQIEHGVYQLDPEEEEEGELSSLRNELYKITVMLREAAEQSKEQKRALADSVSDISHQLKTPLTSCLILLDNLTESEHMDAETRQRFLAEITRQLTGVSWLVATLLKLSRLDAGVVELKSEPIDVDAWLTTVMEKLTLPAEWKRITLERQGDTGVQICGDRRWLEEALMNLVKNALEHSPEGSKICLRVEDNAVYTGIFIQDFGDGISEEDQKHIFERFYRSASAGEDSVGIGLALAKEIIERQNGYLTVESEPGKGSTFLIKFLKCH